MFIIDFHTHYFPDKIAHDAIISLEQKGAIKAFTEGTRSSLERSMSAAGIGLSLNLPVATSPDQVDSINRWSEKNNTAPVLCAGAIHPLSENPDRIISGISDKGLRGIKMHPEYQDFSPDDVSLDPIWKACIRNSVFVIFHAGADVAFKMPFRSNPAKFAKLHKRFPELKMVLAHFGSWTQWDEVEKDLIGLDIFLDTSFTAGFIEDSKFTRLIRSHGADKVIFGTDSPWRDQSKEVKAISSLQLSDTELELVFHRNAEKLLGLK
ncbi:MAG: amidohydrolase family protein [Victivallales bacterium]